MAINEECPYSSGSVYRVQEGLTDFPPDLPNIDYCSRLNFDDNSFTTLENGRCTRCNFLSFNNNKCRELTAAMLRGFPNVKQIRLNNNTIYRIEGDALNGLRRLDVENNPFENFPWDYAPPGLRVSLAGTKLHCDCAMKRAVKRGTGDSGVMIRSAPRCKGDPGKPYEEILRRLGCSQMEQVNTMQMSDRTTGKIFARWCYFSRHLF